MGVPRIWLHTALGRAHCPTPRPRLRWSGGRPRLVECTFIHDWTFRLGPGFIVGVGNGLILGWLMYRSGLVPRGMAQLGLIAGPVLCAGGIAVLDNAGVDIAAASLAPPLSYY